MVTTFARTPPAPPPDLFHYPISGVRRLALRLLREAAQLGHLHRAALRLAGAIGVDSAVSGFLAGITLGRSFRWREKFAVQRALLFWHFRGCPGDFACRTDCLPNCSRLKQRFSP